MDFHPGVKNTQIRIALFFKLLEKYPELISRSQENIENSFGNSFPLYRCVFVRDLDQNPENSICTGFLDWRVLVQAYSIQNSQGYPVLFRYDFPVNQVICVISELKELDEINLSKQGKQEDRLGSISFAWSEGEILVDMKNVPFIRLPLVSPSYGKGFVQLITDWANSTYKNPKQYARYLVETSDKAYAKEELISLESRIAKSSLRIERFLSGKSLFE